MITNSNDNKLFINKKKGKKCFTLYKVIKDNKIDLNI